MSERIDSLDNTVKGEPDLFLDGPSEYLCKAVCDLIKLVPQFIQVFGDRVDPYRRMDYSVRELPALRIYSNQFSKEYDSWFIDGELTCDIISPASLRREETQQIQDSLTSAMLQQFRRVSFFNSVTELVPALNELGKRFTVDKALGFEWGDDMVPLTQITVNFRIDLREWDRHLESDDRTKDQPFERTLGNLEQITATIDGMEDDEETVNVTVELDQEIEE